MGRSLELFCGTKSFSKEISKYNIETFTIDNDPQFEPDLIADILELRLEDIGTDWDIVWASPPCQAFSVAQIGRNWNHDHTPKTATAELGLRLLYKTIELIEQINPKFWFIENPMGKMRKIPVMTYLPRSSLTYCQYGDFRMKPTDIWHNTDWAPRPRCKNSDTCHTSAPRGSQTGTQGMKDAKTKAIIPQELCAEIAQYIWQNS